ncbi:hypothetical protein U2F25_29990 [Micromonospora sp. 4G53]|uniref:Uncharacterized protein n=1 Tax=Micromonospora sicca TaxID=2202420 RepID=A0ABU5JLZ8_9ACTN|nr:hypothetical protein [Micromonospora sp. 4G53]
MDLAGGDLDEEQHVDPLEHHRVDGEEVAGQDRVGLGGQELPPGRSGPSGCRVDPGLVEDSTNLGRSALVQIGAVGGGVLLVAIAALVLSRRLRWRVVS